MSEIGLHDIVLVVFNRLKDKGFFQGCEVDGGPFAAVAFQKRDDGNFIYESEIRFDMNDRHIRSIALIHNKLQMTPEYKKLYENDIPINIGAPNGLDVLEKVLIAQALHKASEKSKILVHA